MKKIPFLFFISLIPSAFLFSKPKIEDNTFASLIVNNSDYSISVDGEKIPPGEKKEHRFPLHTSAMAMGDWNVEYTIPLTESINYVFQEPKALSDNQNKFIIENPNGKFISDCYAVVINNSDDLIQCKGRGTIFYSCYTKGVINSGKELPAIGTVPAHTSAVCPIKPNNEFYIVPDKTGEKLNAGISYRKGYVYFIRYADGKISLQDARPIQCIKEKLWKKEYSKNIVLRDVVQNKGFLYVLGTETLKDSKNNFYLSGFVQCLDRKGNEVWKREYAEKGTDTVLYDMELCSDGSLVIVGQTVAEKTAGVVLLWTADGKSAKSSSVKEVIGLERVRKNSQEGFAAGGYDLDGNPVSVLFDKNLSVTKVVSGHEAAFLGTQSDASKNSLAEDFVQSASAGLTLNDGSRLVAGESSGLERPVATVARLKNTSEYEIFYAATEPNSFVSDMKIISENTHLLISGSMNGKDSFGNGGSPFVRCLDIKTGALLWENIDSEREYEVCTRIAAFDDYGFAEILVNADSDGDVSSPCALIRTNSVGAYDF